MSETQPQPVINIVNQQSSGGGASRPRHGAFWWMTIGWWYAPLAFFYGRGWLWGRKSRSSSSGNVATIR